MESSRFPRMTSDVLPGQQIRATPKVKNVLCCPTLSYRGNRWLLPRVAKQRNGPLGMVGMVFREEAAMFRALARPETQLEGVLR